MTTEDDISKLKDARNKTAEVYESQATDEIPDNGNLTTLNSCVLSLNSAISIIKTEEAE